MSQQTWTAVDDYFNGLLGKEDDALLSAARDSDAAGLPAIPVAPNPGKLLNLLARIRGARRILEIGTLGGYSTIWLARALPDDGAYAGLGALHDLTHRPLVLPALAHRAVRSLLRGAHLPGTPVVRRAAIARRSASARVLHRRAAPTRRCVPPAVRAPRSSRPRRRLLRRPHSLGPLGLLSSQTKF